MPHNIEQMEAMLQKLRLAFVAELPERCDRLESGILALERSPQDQQLFNELYRNVHSLKGSGGTHGLGIITSICHQLETFLTETFGRFNDVFAGQALAYIDLLRKTGHTACQSSPNWNLLEQELEMLQGRHLQSRRAVLVADPSLLMMKLYQKALAKLPLQLAFVGDGLVALERLMQERFDFMIIARELKHLNGIAVTAALRLSRAKNQNIPVIMVTSDTSGLPDFCRVQQLIERNQKLEEQLVDGCLAVMGLSLDGKGS